MARKQREKSQQTKEELLAQAADIFCRKGYKRATIAEITGEAGYAKGTFYRYWGSKDELFFQIMEKRLKAYREARRQKLQNAENADQVIHIVVDFLESIIDDTDWSRVVLEFTIHAMGNGRLKQQLNQSDHRLSTDLFADIFSPFVTDRESTRKLGALVTALFEGFLIQRFLETGVLDKQDLRKAVLILARSFLR